MEYIIKRDGRKVKFNENKIINAIYEATKAIREPSKEIAEKCAKLVTQELSARYNDNEFPQVEEIQDLVENTLIQENYSDIAKEYITYRHERDLERQAKTKIVKNIYDLTFQDAKNNNVKRENANINADSAMGVMLKYGSETSKEFYLEYMLPKDQADAHRKGDIHIHDLDFYALTETCCQIDLAKLFKDGFSTGEGFLREPQSIGSAAALAAIAIQSNQNDQHGGQSIPAFDHYLAPYVAKSYEKNLKNAIMDLLSVELDEEDPMENQFLVKIKEDLDNSKLPTYKSEDDKMLYDIILKDLNGILFEDKESGLDVQLKNRIIERAIKIAEKKTKKDTYQAMEGFIHNLNTMHSRAGAQVPFSSINYGTCTSPEGRLLIEQLLLATDAGLGKGETPIFPIQIFKLKSGVSINPEDPNYDLFELACKVSAKRLFPNFSNIDAPFNLQYYKEDRKVDTEVSYMGCRTRVIGNVYDPENEIVTSRGNLSFTSINLPRLAIQSKGNIDTFFKKLDKMLELVAEQLLFRFEIQAKKHVYNYPFLMEQHVWLDSDKLQRTDEVREVLKHGTLSIGFIGLAEALVSLIGKHHGESEEAQKLGLEIVGHIREFCDNKSKETGMNFTCLATPAEGLSGRFVNIDKKKYGKIEGVTDREYYTNSFHVPVYYKTTAKHKVDVEAPYHALTNAGHISYIEMDGDPLKNLSAFESLVKYMYKKNMGYFSINHPVDRCSICGFTGVIEGDTCPNCGRTIEEHKKETIKLKRCDCN